MTHGSGSLIFLACRNTKSMFRKDVQGSSLARVKASEDQPRIATGTFRASEGLRLPLGDHLNVGWGPRSHSAII